MSTNFAALSFVTLSNTGELKDISTNLNGDLFKLYSKSRKICDLVIVINVKNLYIGQEILYTSSIQMKALKSCLELHC